MASLDLDRATSRPSHGVNRISRANSPPPIGMFGLVPVAASTRDQTVYGFQYPEHAVNMAARHQGYLPLALPPPA